jgi:hypothetical protein
MVNRNKSIGGGIIGTGIGGQVHYPALSCQDPTENPKGDYVTKVMNPANAELEWNSAKQLQRFNPKYAIFPLHRCTYKKDKELLFSKYGGKTLVDYFYELENHAYAKPPKPLDNKKVYIKIIKTMKRFKIHLNDLHSHNIYHNDLTYENFLYNPDKDKLYLIDFGRSSNTNIPIQGDMYTLNLLIDDFEKMFKRIYPDTNFTSRERSHSRSRSRSHSRSRSRSHSRSRSRSHSRSRSRSHSRSRSRSHSRSRSRSHSRSRSRASASASSHSNRKTRKSPKSGNNV